MYMHMAHRCIVMMHLHQLIMYAAVSSPLLAEGLTLGRSCLLRNNIRSVPFQLGFGTSNEQEEERGPLACLEGYIPEDQSEHLERVLLSAGYQDVIASIELENGYHKSTSAPVYRYKFVKATGMLKLLEDPSNGSRKVPNYIPIHKGMENVLFDNGWSFLDPDESEPISAFDVDAANKEGQYKPMWGLKESRDDTSIKLSSLGYNIQRETYENIIEASLNEGVSSQAKSVLLEGGTDQPYVKRTNNGYDFSTSALQTEHEGVFVCAIGSLPLFSTADLAPPILSASSGWLSFKQPISEEHVELVHPDKLDLDQRVEVIDAQTGCHLGHFFGKDGYCINASALNFLPVKDMGGNCIISPFSWRLLLDDAIVNNEATPESPNPSRGVLREKLLSTIQTEEILFGAGCFWHIEFALRRLPGVIDTKTGYAGGVLASPTYKDICTGTTSHAEVVKVTFDPTVCDARKLVDCWLAMHDPTNVRAHGKRAKNTGQYRSCVFAFTFSKEIQCIASEAISACQQDLQKELSCEVRLLDKGDFWAAEDRHQRHDERKRDADFSTLIFHDWLLKYGRRRKSVFGSSETIQVEADEDDLDDGMAMMMI